MAAISTFIAAASVGATLMAGNQAKKQAKNQQADAKRAQDQNLAKAREEMAQNERQAKAEQAAAAKQLEQQRKVAEQQRIQAENERRINEQNATTARERRLLDPTANETDTRVSLGTNSASDKLLSRGGRRKTKGAGAAMGTASGTSTATKVGGL